MAPRAGQYSYASHHLNFCIYSILPITSSALYAILYTKMCDSFCLNDATHLQLALQEFSSIFHCCAAQLLCVVFGKEVGIFRRINELS